jgi:hypothetical protein
MIALNVNDVNKAIGDLNKEIDGLTDYMKLKMQQRDWHGVADAAMDIRELEAQILILKGLF